MGRVGGREEAAIVFWTNQKDYEDLSVAEQETRVWGSGEEDIKNQPGFAVSYAVAGPSMVRRCSPLAGRL